MSHNLGREWSRKAGKKAIQGLLKIGMTAGQAQTVAIGFQAGGEE